MTDEPRHEPASKDEPVMPAGEPDAIEPMADFDTLHFAVGNDLLVVPQGGPLADVRLYFPKHFRQLGFRKLLSPESSPDAVLVHVGFAEPRSTPIGFAFDSVVAVGVGKPQWLFWNVRGTTRRRAVLGIREGLVAAGYQIGTLEQAEVEQFIQLLRSESDETGDNP